MMVTSDGNGRKKAFYEHLRVLFGISGGFVYEEDIKTLMMKYEISELQEDSIRQFCEENGISIIDKNTVKPSSSHPGFNRSHLWEKAAAPKEPERTSKEDVPDYKYDREYFNLTEECFERLSSREKAILRLRIGLAGEQAHSLQEIAERYGITRERARQVEAKALRKAMQMKRQKDRAREASEQEKPMNS